MLIKGRKHLEQWDSGLRNKDTYLYFSKITSDDNQPLHMREHLEYQRFRLWHCSLPAYPPTCLSSNLCISTILSPTLTHSQAFVLMSPLPNHLSLPPPSLPAPFLFTRQQVLSSVYSPLLRSCRSLSLFPPLSLSLSLSLSVHVSVAAGRRSEDAITAAQEGGWKKKHTRQTAPIPSGLSTPIGPTSGFLTRQTAGKLLQPEDIGVLGSISPTWWSPRGRLCGVVPSPEWKVST